MKNRRQEKTVEMINGYDSAVTPAVGIRNATWMWIIPGLAWIALGLFSMQAGVADDFRNQANWIGSLKAGSGALLAVTFVFGTIWAVKAYMNIRRLGKKPGIGFKQFGKRQILPLIGSIVGVVGFFVSSDNADTFFTIMIISLGSIIPMLALDGMKMFWRTSSPPIGLEEELPHGAVFGFGAVIAHIAALRWLLASDYSFGFFLDAALMVGAGIALAAAGYFLAPLYGMVAQRQEERLQIIINQVEEPDEDSSSAPVTNQQINEAWQSSQGLVSFDH